MKQLMEWSKGNPGALTFLMSLLAPEQLGNAMVIIPELEKNNIRGTDLYILWSDLCNKNNDAVSMLITNCPKDKLEEACSKQDYSGRQIVKEWLDPVLEQIQLRDESNQAAHETNTGM